MDGKGFTSPRAAAGMALAAILILTGMTFHHGWTNYHQDIELTYVGVITSNDIGNPHTYIDLRVTQDESDTSDDDRARSYDGVSEWNVVLAPLSRMQNRGMTDNAMLEVGSTVTIVGYPHRDIEQEMRAERIIIGDVTIELR